MSLLSLPIAVGILKARGKIATIVEKSEILPNQIRVLEENQPNDLF